MKPNKLAYVSLAAALVAVAGLIGGVLSQPDTHVEQIQLQPHTTPLAEVVSEPAKLLDEPLAAVVPHHDLVKDKRTAMLEELSSVSQPETIVVISPDHFNQAGTTAITTDRSWSVAGGSETIEPNRAVIDALVEAGQVYIEDAPFNTEHGIKNLLSEIHQLFPQANLVPIVVQETAGQEHIRSIADTIQKNCDDCGVIASVDMSHYNPALVADIHDKKTIRALTNLDQDEIRTVEVDCTACLQFLIEWAEYDELTHFEVVDQTNSGHMVNNLDVETTTHIFGYYSNDIEADPVQDFISFTFAGDAMFGREVGYQYQERFPELFANLGDRYFWGTDIAWINVEGPISDQYIAQDRTPNNLVFNFSRHTMDALEYLKLNAVGLGNNHTHNKGQTGYETTQRVLEEAGIVWHGSPYSVDDNAALRYEEGEVKVSLISVHGLVDTAGTTDLISAEKDAGYTVVVLPHWGPEYHPRHSSGQEALATAWVEAGADLIIGAHPHVIQDAQIIDETLVFYSLGNFIFDQTFSIPTQQGLMLTGTITSDRITIIPVPMQSFNLQPEILQGQPKWDIINTLCADIPENCTDGVISINL